MRRVRRVAAGLVVAAGLLAAPAAQAQELPGTYSLAALDVPAAPWMTFGNAQPAATFDQPAPDAFTVSAAGADLWRATDEYGVVYLPDATPEHFEAVVKVASFNGTHNAAKAGIMVRNDVTVAKSTATWSSARRATARPSSSTTPAATARSTTSRSPSRPAAARSRRRCG